MVSSISGPELYSLFGQARCRRYSSDEGIGRGLNNEALFWNTVLGGLQTSVFIALAANAA
jgi:hypothetical protein